MSADLAAGDVVLLGEGCRITLVHKTGSRARLVIEAPNSVTVRIDRQERPAAAIDIGVVAKPALA